MAGEVVVVTLDNLESIVVAVDKAGGDSPGELAVGTSGGNGNTLAEVLSRTLAEEDRDGAGASGSPLDVNALASLDGGRDLGEGNIGHGGRDEGSARENDLEETHVD